MQAKELIKALNEMPIIAAIKDENNIDECVKSEASVVFILSSTILNIQEIISRVKNSKKAVFVHLDLIDGLAARDVTVEFIRSHTDADGIISTRPGVLRKAKELNFITVQRFFLLDSLSLYNMQKQLEHDSVDLIEVLPGMMPKIIRQIAATTQKPIIAGGLLSDKEDVMNALSAGACAVSSTSKNIWSM